MWEIIGTALLAGSAGFVAGAYWIVRYVPARGVDFDEEEKTAHPQPRPYLVPAMAAVAERMGEAMDEAVRKAARESTPVTHLVRGGYTECCGVRTDKLPWGELVTANAEAVTCKEVWW